jgi:hypothetical protein
VKASVISPLVPEKVYVVGAAGWWLQRWSVTNADRKRRIKQSYERKYGERIERRRQYLLKIDKAISCLIH